MALVTIYLEVYTIV